MSERAVLSLELRLALQMAVRQASTLKHEYLLLEHLLLAMLSDEDVRDYLRACEGDPDGLKSELEDYLANTVEAIKDAPEDHLPEQSLAFGRTFGRAAAHVVACGKGRIDNGDIIAQIFAEEKCFAQQALVNQGVTRAQFIEVLSNPDFEARVIAKTPARLIGEPPDVARAVVFLASPAARFITGATLFVDGGLSL